ncbi:7-dehydrocholesterol reductase [Linum perenne]
MAAESNTVHSPLVTYVSVVSLLSLCPPFVILLWYTMVHADGSISQTWDYLAQTGLKGLVEIWPKPTATAWKIIGCYAAFEAALQLLLPGKTVEGPISPKGNRPVYKVLFRFGIFNAATVYDHLGEIFSALIFGSLIFCVFLYIKGMELYPRIGKNFDIKVFTNCRFGMMSWAVLALTYCFKQLALLILAAGIVCIFVNYDCDRQRQEFRRTNGKCLVWGKSPSKVVFHSPF